MAAKKKVADTTDTIAPTNELTEVELSDAYKGITSIISNVVIDFSNDKAQVSAEAAETLREQGIIK